MENEMEPDVKNALKCVNEDILESKLKRRSIRLQNLQNTELPESSPKLSSTNDLKCNNENGLELHKEYDENNYTNATLHTHRDNIEQSSESLKPPNQSLPMNINKNVETKYFKRNNNINTNSLPCDIQTENVSKVYKIISKPISGNQSPELKSAVQSKSPIKTYANPRKFAEKKPPIESFALPDNPLSCQSADIALPEPDNVLDTKILDAKEITIQDLQFVDEPWCIIDLEENVSNINEIRIKADPQKLCYSTEYTARKDSIRPVRRLLDVESGSIEKPLKKLPSGKSKTERIVAKHSLTLEEHEVEIFNSGTVQNVSDSTGIKTNRLSKHSQNGDIDIPVEVVSEFCERRHLRSSSASREVTNKKERIQNSTIENSTDSGNIEVDFDVPKRILRSNSCTDLYNFEQCRKSAKLKKSNSQTNLVSDKCSKTNDAALFINLNLNKSNNKIHSVTNKNRELKCNPKQLKVTLYQLPLKSKANKGTKSTRGAKRSKMQVFNKKPANLPEKNKNTSCGMMFEVVHMQRDHTDFPSKSTSETPPQPIPPCNTRNLNDTSETDVTNKTSSITEGETSISHENFSFKRKSKSAANAKLNQYFHRSRSRKSRDLSPVGGQVSENIAPDTSSIKTVLNEDAKLFDISSPNSTSTPNNRPRGGPRKKDKSVENQLSTSDQTEEDADKQQNYNKRKKGRPKKRRNKKNGVLNAETTETDLSVSADAPVKQVNKENGSNVTETENEENNTSRSLRSSYIKIQEQSEDGINQVKDSTAAEIDIVEDATDKRNANKEDNKTIQSTEIEINKNCCKTEDRPSKTPETSKNQDLKDPIDGMDVDPTENHKNLCDKTAPEFETNLRNVENLLDSTDEEISAINEPMLEQNLKPKRSGNAGTKINGQLTDFNSKSCAPIKIVETNSTHVLDDLNITKEMSQKRTRSKTSLGDLVDDSYELSIDLKTKRVNGVKEDLMNGCSPTKAPKSKIVEKDSPQIVESKTGSDAVDLEDRPIQLLIDEHVFPRKPRSRISDNNRSTKTKLNGSGNIDLNKTASPKEINSDITIDDRIDFEIDPDNYSRRFRNKRSIDRRLSRSGRENMSIEGTEEFSSRITRSKSSLGSKNEVDSDTEDLSSRITRSKSSLGAKNEVDSDTEDSPKGRKNNTTKEGIFSLVTRNKPALEIENAGYNVENRNNIEDTSNVMTDLQENIDNNNLNKKNLVEETLDVNKIIPNVEEILNRSKSRDETEIESDNIKIISSETGDDNNTISDIEKALPSKITRSKISLGKRTSTNDNNNIIDSIIDSSSIIQMKNGLTNEETQNVANETQIEDIFPQKPELDDSSFNKKILDEKRELERVLDTNMFKENDATIRTEGIENSVKSDENLDTNDTDNVKIVTSGSTHTEDDKNVIDKDRIEKIEIGYDDIDFKIDSLKSTTKRNSFSDDEPFSLELRDSPCLETETISNGDGREENSANRAGLEENSVEKEIDSLESKTPTTEQTVTVAAIPEDVPDHLVTANEFNKLEKRIYRTRSYSKDFVENINDENIEVEENGSKTALIEERKNSLSKTTDDNDGPIVDFLQDQIETSLIKPKVNDGVEDSDYVSKMRRNVAKDSKPILEEIETTAKIGDDKPTEDGIKSTTNLDGTQEVITTDVEFKRARGRPRSKSVSHRYTRNADGIPMRGRLDEAGTTQKTTRDRRSSSVGPRKYILKKMLNDYKKYAIPYIAKPVVGEIGWAQIGNYPYWPCVVTNDPTSNNFTKSVLKKYVSTIFYHVRFFGDRGRRAWITSKKLMKYTDRDDLKRMHDCLKEVKLLSELHVFTVKEYLKNKWRKSLEEVEYVKSQNYNLEQILTFLDLQSQDAQEGEYSESTKSKETHKRKTNKNNDDSTIIRPPENDTSIEDVHVKKKIKLSTKSSPSTSKKEKHTDSGVSEDPVEQGPVKVEEVVIKDEISEIEYKVSVDSIQHFGYYSLADQRALYKRNNLFKGIPKDKVCQFCFNFGELYRCKGGCQGIYHLKCSVQVLVEKVPKRRKIRSPKAESMDVRKVEKQEHSSGNQSEVDESHVQIITVPSSVCATPPGKTFPPDVMNMNLVDRIDFKMKEIMKKFESKAYLDMLNESTSDEKPTSSPSLRNRSFSMCQDLFSVGNQTSPQRSILFNKELDAMTKVDQRSPTSAEQIEESLEMILKPPVAKHVTADSPGESPNSSGQAIKDENRHVIADAEDSASESNAKHKSKNPNRTRKSKTKHVTADFPSPPDRTPTSVPPEAKKPNGARKSLLKHVTADVDSVETVDSESLRSNSSRQSKQSEIYEHVELAYRNINLKHFKCGFCTEDIDPYCFICHDSVSRTGSNMRHKCSLYRCSRFYHPECLKLWPQTQWSLIQTTKNRFSQEEVDSFVCPQHVCHTCASDDPRAAISRCSGDKIVKCLSCPASYHSTNLCVPAGTEIITSTQIVCPRHRTKTVKNHTINTTWCFICNEGGNLICCEICPTSVHPECMSVNLTVDDKFICEDCESGRLPLYDEIVWVKVGQYKWWPGLILFPNEVPPNVFNAKHTSGEFVVKFFGTYDHFWVNRGRSFLFQEGDTVDTGSNAKNKVETVFKKAVEEAVVAHKMKRQFKSIQAAETASSLKPPPYIKIKSSKPVGNVKFMELNLSNTTACECDPNQPNPCGPDSNCLNRLLWTECNPEVCPAGELCKNQSFEQREYPPLVPYKTATRGWGLKTLAPIKKGIFVIEYVGELIDDEEYQRRVMKMHAQKEENYYFLTIHTNRMIDAGPKGNVARFMNHCCQPNCETQKWTVNGETRVGLFATEDIEAHAELTFNYNLESTGTEKKVCKCGAPNCSGFIGVKAKQESTEPKKPKKLRKKEPVKAIVLPPCFICQKKGDVGLCNNKICNKAYHLGCLKLDEWPEGKKYVCPWHYCNACSKRTIRCCVKCLNSFCPSHSEGNIRYDNLLGFVCNIHEPATPNTISSVKKKRSTLTSEEAVVTSTTGDDDDVPLIFRRKWKKSKQPCLGDSSNVDSHSDSSRRPGTESQDEMVSSATASDFEDELKPKRKRKAKRKMKNNGRMKIVKSSKNVHQMNTANSNNDNLNSSNISR